MLKIIKYPQSNFLIESDNTRILIDPGFLTFKSYKVDEFGKLDAILITHQHPDHLDKKAVKKFIDSGIPLYGNHDVSSQFEDEPFDITKVFHDKDIKIGSVDIKPVDLPHFKNLWCDSCNVKITPDTINKDKKCSLHPNKEPKEIDGPPNTGFLINDTFFHPGDGLEIKDFSAKSASIPIGGPTVDYDKAWRFANSLNAKVIIPMHYSIPIFGADPQEFAKEAEEGIKVAILENKGHLEIT